MNMKSLRTLLVAMLTLIGAPRAWAVVTAEEAWVRATVPGQNTAAAYVRLRSTEAARLLGIRTPAAARGEIHEMSMENGIMKMRRIPTLALPAGRLVELKPGAHHLMLMNVAKPLKTGDKIALTLIIEREGKSPEELEVTAEVRTGREVANAHRH